MSLMKLGSRAMWRIAMLLITYFAIGPAYYGVLDAMHAQAVLNGGAELTTFIAWVYPMFYLGFPTLIVLGIIFTLVGFYGQLRKKFFATTERGVF